MCYLIYGTLILSFAVYSDALLSQYALSIATGDGHWTVVALGWELMAAIWPLLALIAALSSALTWVAVRRTQAPSRSKASAGPP
jgi:hypothetical protein